MFEEREDEGIFKDLDKEKVDHYDSVIDDFFQILSNAEDYCKKYSLKLSPSAIEGMNESGEPSFTFNMGIIDLYETFAMLMAIPESDFTPDLIRQMKIRLLFHITENVFKAEFIDVETAMAMVEAKELKNSKKAKIH